MCERGKEWRMSGMECTLASSHLNEIVVIVTKHSSFMLSCSPNSSSLGNLTQPTAQESAIGYTGQVWFQLWLLFNHVSNLVVTQLICTFLIWRAMWFTVPTSQAGFEHLEEDCIQNSWNCALLFLGHQLAAAAVISQCRCPGLRSRGPWFSVLMK